MVQAVRFKRVAEAFGDAGDRVRRLCENSSSGSDHSPPSPTKEEESLTADLSDLVNSFLERSSSSISSTSLEILEEEDEDIVETRRSTNNNCTEYNYQTTKNGPFKGLFVNSPEDEDEDEAKSRILAAVERALHEVGGNVFLSTDFNRRLMARLRYRGFDSGLCKSKWEKTGSCPSGYHEYIDVMLAGNRYIVQVSLAKEFEIARPTPCYQQLLNHFPQIFVGKAPELKHIVKIMCKSMKKSMKTMEMPIPPWRRQTYVHAKWFSSYKRTTNEFPATSTVLHKVASSSNYYNSCDHEEEEDELIRRRKKSVGFVPPAVVLSPLMLYVSCRGEGVAVNHANFKMGNLAAALQDTTTALLL